MNTIFENPLIEEYFENHHIGTHKFASMFASDIVTEFFAREGIYHNGTNHIWPMIDYFGAADGRCEFKFNEEDQFIGFFFALFHDVGSNINEARQILTETVNMNDNKFRRLFLMVHEAIQATDYRFENISELPYHVKMCVRADVIGLAEMTESKIKWQEDLIFREYSHFDYSSYKAERIRILSRIYDICMIDKSAWKIRKGIIENRKPRIAVYAGSFNPFHIGHYSVLKQAEQNFDKVIIAVGVNVNKKTNATDKVLQTLKYHQVEYYSCDLPAKLGSYDYPVTLIRGLRNGMDLQYEQNMRQTLKDMDKDISIVYYLCDPEHNHVSSSMIRELDSFGKDTSKYIELEGYERGL